MTLALEIFEKKMFSQFNSDFQVKTNNLISISLKSRENKVCVLLYHVRDVTIPYNGTVNIPSVSS